MLTANIQGFNYVCKEILYQNMFSPLEPCSSFTCTLPIYTKTLKVRPTSKHLDFFLSLTVFLWAAEEMRNHAGPCVVPCVLPTPRAPKSLRIKLVTTPELPQNPGGPTELS